MTIYIDDIAIKAKGRVWYHLMSDTDDDEIHKFAARLGLKRAWYHVDHYDVAGEHKRNAAIQLGAVPVPTIELVKIRKAKRRANQ